MFLFVVKPQILSNLFYEQICSRMTTSFSSRCFDKLLSKHELKEVLIQLHLPNSLGSVAPSTEDYILNNCHVVVKNEELVRKNNRTANIVKPTVYQSHFHGVSIQSLLPSTSPVFIFFSPKLLFPPIYDAKLDKFLFKKKSEGRDKILNQPWDKPANSKSCLSMELIV